MDVHDAHRLALLVVGRRVEQRRDRARPPSSSTVSTPTQGSSRRAQPQEAAGIGEAVQLTRSPRSLAPRAMPSGVRLSRQVKPHDLLRAPGVKACRSAAARPRAPAPGASSRPPSSSRCGPGAAARRPPLDRGDAEDQHRHVERQHQQRQQHAAAPRAQVSAAPTAPIRLRIGVPSARATTSSAAARAPAG